MTEPQKIKAADIDKYLEESKGLERDYTSELLTSRRNAWYITFLFGVITIVALVAAILGLKREVLPPVVLRVDNATGAVDMLTHLRESETSYGEVVDIYWLNKYVLNRESYDFNNIQMSYDTTALLSTDEVQKEYYAAFEGEHALDKTLGNHTRVIVNIKSITPHQYGGSAVVRFTTQKVSNNGYNSQVRHLDCNNWL